MDNWSALWVLMAWCFSTRPSAPAVLSRHPCVSRCLWVNTHIGKQFTSKIHRREGCWTNDDVLSNGVLGTKLNKIIIKISIFFGHKNSSEYVGNLVQASILTHWGRVAHICVGNLTINGSDNGLSPGRRQSIIWTNTGILLIGPLGTNFSEISIAILAFSFKKMCLKVLSVNGVHFVSAPMR